jgi:aspartate ammonia-lyase
MPSYRNEHDFLGKLETTAYVHLGIYTQRAISNFLISGFHLNSVLIKSIALVKKSCCQANLATGHLNPKKSQAIITACNEITDRCFTEQFQVDALQGCAGISANMNLTEVITNRDIKILSGTKVDYSLVHPFKDVNLHQSTNEVFHSAIKIAGIYGLRALAKSMPIYRELSRKRKNNSLK